MKNKPQVWIKADAGGIREMRQPSAEAKKLNRYARKGIPYQRAVPRLYRTNGANP